MKFIAITDESNHCECCGKNNLKKVVVMQNAAGDFVRYGVNCAARAMGYNKVKMNTTLETIEAINRALAIHTPVNAVKLLIAQGYKNARFMGNYDGEVFTGYIMVVGTAVKVLI